MVLEKEVEVIHKDLVEKEQRITVVDERVVVVDQERRDNDKMLGRGIKETSERPKINELYHVTTANKHHVVSVTYYLSRY